MTKPRPYPRPVCRGNPMECKCLTSIPLSELNFAKQNSEIIEIILQMQSAYAGSIEFQAFSVDCKVDPPSEAVYLCQFNRR